MSYKLYKHTNKTNGKVYYGITRQAPERRWQKGYGYADNSHFFNAIKKYGWDGFFHEIILEGLSKEKACEFERLFIARDKTNNREYGYNISSGGETVDCVPKRTGADNPRSQSVNCFDKNHNFIARYETQTEAADVLGICRKGITKNCRGESKTYKGFIFEYANMKFEKPKKYPIGKHKNHRKHKVNLLDSSGNVVKTYNCVADAATDNEGCRAGGIVKCCNGYLKTYKNRGWCYAD